MAGGATYVPVTGEVANNGIMTLSGSSEGGGGEEVSGFWLRWTASGFSGIGWFEDDTPIEEWWNSYNATLGYADGTQGLSNWITNENVSDLSDFFDTWDNYSKGNFIYTHRNVYDQCADPI